MIEKGGMHGQKTEWNDKNAKKRNQAAESEAVDINLQWNTETYGKALQKEVSC